LSGETSNARDNGQLLLPLSEDAQQNLHAILNLALKAAATDGNGIEVAIVVAGLNALICEAREHMKEDETDGATD